MTSFSPLAASGGTTPYVYSHSGTLPPGLALSASTGEVTGTPTAIFPTAQVIFSVQDANAVVASTTSTVSFTVSAATPAITATANTTPQNLTVGIAMASFAPLTPGGGTAPYTYGIATGTLPAGLSLDAATGAVTGTPIASYAAANVVFTVKDAQGFMASTTSAVSFTVVAASPTITATANATPQTLTVGIAMASLAPLTPSGGTTPYTYSMTSGALPAGLSLSASAGTVTGVPSASYATANVVFSVKDANNVVASTTSTVSFTVTAPSTSITATANTTAQNLTIGTAMTGFAPLIVSGGTPPYSYSILSGALVAGVNLDASTGVVAGTPLNAWAAGNTTQNVVFTVQDANHVVASTTSTVSFTVGPVGYIFYDGLYWTPISLTAVGASQAQAVAICNGAFNGHAGWRLPTILELTGLLAPPAVQSTPYAGGLNGSGLLTGQDWLSPATAWSSTAGPPLGVNSTHYAAGLSGPGATVIFDLDSFAFNVTCVSPTL